MMKPTRLQIEEGSILGKQICKLLQERGSTSAGPPNCYRIHSPLAHDAQYILTQSHRSWPKDGLIERASALVRAQIETVETLTGDMDPKTNFSLIIIQTEVERWKFLLRALLRARLAKIDRHALHYLSTPELQARMSASEVAYATRHQQLLHGHYLGSFLGAFPPQLQHLNDTAGGISMVEGPDMEEAVFVRGLGRGDEPVVVLGRGRDVDSKTEVKRGEVVVARWADVRELVETGEMELV